MKRSLVAAAFLAIVLTCGAETRTYVHRIALIFEPGSLQIPQNGIGVLKSMYEDSKRECLDERSIAIDVEDVVALPLGKSTAGPTPRTQQVAAAIREQSGKMFKPYEGSLSPESDRVRRLGLAVNQVIVELSCPRK